jgi:Pregnancy-associated plasma protein-A
MKKLFTYLLGGMLLGGACTENVTNEDSVVLEATHRECASMEVLQAQLAADPKLQGRMQSIEEHTRSFIAEGGRLVNGKIQIPVIVNVLYRTGAENISDAQIASQIAVLNEDYNATNADVSKTPSVFAAADIDISFVLEGVNRKYSSKRSWSTNDDMKRSSKGGIDPTDPSKNLNMWVVNKMSSQGRTILGYAQFPGGPASTDGVVMGYNFFGRVGVLSQPYHLGRTATHEVGHWLNLRHIWGDATCGSDLVNDTPTHNTANFGCPTQPHLSTCSGTPREMTMNYMDYTDDACMYMFTTGQKTRSLAVFAGGGPRASFAQ